MQWTPAALASRLNLLTRRTHGPSTVTRVIQAVATSPRETGASSTSRRSAPSLLASGTRRFAHSVATSSSRLPRLLSSRPPERTVPVLQRVSYRIEPIARMSTSMPVVPAADPSAPSHEAGAANASKPTTEQPKWNFPLSPVPPNPLGEGRYIKTAAALIIGCVAYANMCAYGRTV